MKNRELYAEKIINMSAKGETFAVNMQDNLMECHACNCGKCKFNTITNNCQKSADIWLEQEAKQKEDDINDMLINIVMELIDMIVDAEKEYIKLCYPANIHSKEVKIFLHEFEETLKREYLYKYIKERM